MKMLALALPLLFAAPQAKEGLIFFGGTQPRASVGGDGRIGLAFLFLGDINYAYSDSDGQTWSAPIKAIDAKGKARAGAQRGPRIGCDSKHGVYITAPICFDEEELKSRDPVAELWLTISTDGGEKFGPPIQINDQPKSAAEALHDSAVTPGGEVHVAWIDKRAQAKGNGQDLFYAKVVDGKVGKNLKIADNICPCCAPSIAVDNAGNPIVVYRDGSNTKSREVMMIRSSDGGAKWGKAARITKTDSNVPN